MVIFYKFCFCIIMNHFYYISNVHVKVWMPLLLNNAKRLKGFG